MQGGWETGCSQFITVPPCHFFSFFTGSSLGSLPWATGLHKLLQCSSHNCSSSWTTLVRVFSTGHSPPGRDHSIDPQFLPENLLLHGFLSLSCNSWLRPAPAWYPHGLWLPSGHLHLLQWVLRRLQCGYLFQHGPPQAAASMCFTTVLSMGCRESLLQWLVHLSPLPSLTSLSAGLFPTAPLSSTLLPQLLSFYFSKTVSKIKKAKSE